MMAFNKISAFVIIVLCILAGQSEAQECFTQNVVDLKLDTNHNLTWSLRPDEPCEIDGYLIYIFHPGQPAEYVYNVNDTYLDVSFLEVCEEWTFVVVAISNNSLGRERRIVEKLPLPADADLSLRNLNVEHNPDTGLTHLYWDLADKRYGNCSLKYQVTVQLGGAPVLDDVTVDTDTLDLHFLSSCTSYLFAVRAINVAHPIIEGPWRAGIHGLPGRRQVPPMLNDVQVGATSVNMSFRLESEVRNPCPLKELYIYGGPAFSQTITLSNEGTRRPVNVSIINLQPGTTYQAWVYVSNSAGWSGAESVQFETLNYDEDEVDKE